MLLPPRKSKYPWHTLQVGESFFIYWTRDEARFPAMQRARRSSITACAWRKGRWKLAFSTKSSIHGLLITRVEWRAGKKSDRRARWYRKIGAASRT
jgi:hypothetical protein